MQAYFNQVKVGSVDNSISEALRPAVRRALNCQQTLALVLSFFVIAQGAYGAIGQFLDDIFFQNPAELSMVHQAQAMGGNIFITPSFEFTGISAGGPGTQVSKVVDYLPYILTAYRTSDKWVLGLNVTPSDYGHLNWPTDSVVAFDSTETNVIYYRAGAQASYQFSDDLAFGIGFNLEYQKLLELNFEVRQVGDQINKLSGLNYSGDVGLLYHINAQNSLTAAVYTPVDYYAYGTSSLGERTVDTFSSNVTQAAVAYVGLQHTLNDKWFVGEKIYWSGWSIQKYTNLINTVTGDYRVLTDWQDIWSLQMITRYAFMENITLLGSVTYESNPVSADNNQIGYPLSSSIYVSAGLDIALQKGWSAQVIYGYGTFLPDATLNTFDTIGTVTQNTQVGVLQFTYKI